MSSLDLIRPDLRNCAPYIASDNGAPHRLHLNELPWSPVGSGLNYYSAEESSIKLEAELADLYEVASNQLLVTRSANEGIDFLMRLFLRAGMDSILQFSPTFSMYSFFAKLQGASVVDYPLDAENSFSLTFEQVQAAWHASVKLIFLCRPNNPTAMMPNLSLITALCKEFKDRSIIVIDEAYIEFSEEASATSLLNQFDNLIVLRTLSKAHGLAGLRIGSIIAQAPLIQMIRNAVPPFRLANPVIEMAQKALLDTTFVQKSVARIAVSRAILVPALEGLSWIEKVYSGQINSVFVRTMYAQDLLSYLFEKGFQVRAFNSPDLQHYLRITIGTEEQTRLLMEVLEGFKEK
jgi:histidinol-phosphate aminotransferase